MQKARSQERLPKESSLLPLVGTRFQDLFHSPSGVLFTFPSRYWFTIGHGRVCSLGGWSPQLPTGFLVPRRTQGPKPQIQVVFRLQDSHLVSWSVPAHFDYTPGTCGTMPRFGPTTPMVHAPRFGLLPVRSPLLGESRLISLPGATEMFQFTPLASHSLFCSGGDDSLIGCRVSPFGHRRIKGCVLLPDAFRSLPRPSSPVRA